MNKFTRGPWSWHGDELLSQEYKAFILATRRDSRPEGANRQLIAAAPDLYGALQELEALGGLGQTAHAIIRAALSKASP